MNPKLLILLPALVLLAGCGSADTPVDRAAFKRCMEATKDRQYCLFGAEQGISFHQGWKEYTYDH